MTDWLRAFTIWRNRRKRFAEEWAFHMDEAAARWQAVGIGARDARKLARSSLGSRRAYRRDALRTIGGDFAGLVDLLPVRRTSRSRFLVPMTLAILSALAIAINPERAMALKSLAAIAVPGAHARWERLIPLTPAGMVPVDFFAAVLRALVLAGLLRIAFDLAPRSTLRLCAYAAASLAAMALAAAICWVHCPSGASRA